MTPSALKGKDFETLLMDAAKRAENNGLLTMGRYGVQGMVVADKKNPGKSTTLLVPSLPDFEGCLAGGRQFNIEAKVWTNKSFQVDKKFIKPRQVSHMLTRSRFGVLCFLLIYFAERRGVNFVDPAITVAIPVCGRFPIWQNFLDAVAAAKADGVTLGTYATISRDEAQEMGQLVPWRTPKGCRKHLPDLMSFLCPELISASGKTTLPGACQTGNPSAPAELPNWWIASAGADQPEPTRFG